MAGEVRIGTSGWHYKHWIGVFYPDELRPRGWLAHYIKYFDTVEINSTFYHLQPKTTFAGWREAAPPGFIYAPKGSRYLSHVRKLTDPEEPLQRFLDSASELGPTLGPVLWQFPPRWERDVERLRQFVVLLPAGWRFAFEFRDSSWFHEDTYELLRPGGHALCIYDMGGEESPEELTADWTYLRFHGPSARYASNYPEDALQRWAERIAGWRDRGMDVYAYFNNDAHGYAVANAQTLRELLA
ncbi:hypothetical protein AMK68_00350 [candidate division KD3-62 bacterium DG_56]|uniref:DUF72 domain-containing protein n=1 Tax=candidate division KD3-62 bacterium DG_56 TaxID=1704032 RepID=A0A0S7XRE2_9BACT|nr:MAG: hypothetical protein AMK68_00350 [candidate division KD3-62 bacterium DG_56]